MYGPAPYTKGAVGAPGNYTENYKSPGVKTLGYEYTASSYAPYKGSVAWDSAPAAKSGSSVNDYM